MIDEQDKFIVFIIRAKGLVKRQVLVGVKNRAIHGNDYHRFLYLCLETSLACVAGILKEI